MKRIFSIVIIFSLMSVMLCGCNLFSGGNGSDERVNGVLPIPSSGQTYSKRVVYHSIKDSENDTASSYSSNNLSSSDVQPYNGYMAVRESVYGENQTKVVSVLFDANGNMVYDGGANGKFVGGVMNGKMICTNIPKPGEYSSDVNFVFIDPQSGEESSFFEGYTPVNYKNGKWTVINSAQKYGILDESGNVVIPCNYDVISTFDDKGGAIVVDKEEEKSAMIDMQNNILIPYKYELIFPFNGEGNYSEAIYGNKPLYDGYGYTSDYTIASSDGNDVIFIDREGNKLFDMSDSSYSGASPRYASSGSLDLFPVESDGVIGFVNLKGEEVIPPKYNDIVCDFINGYACVALGSSYGVINSKDETVLPFNYSDIAPFDQKGLAEARLIGDSDNYYIIDLVGNIAYTSDHSLTPLGNGYFIDGNDLILITKDGGDYNTYEPQVYISTK